MRHALAIAVVAALPLCLALSSGIGASEHGAPSGHDAPSGHGEAPAAEAGHAASEGASESSGHEGTSEEGAEAAPPKPVRVFPDELPAFAVLVRTLGTFQDQIALGRNAAQANLRDILVNVSKVAQETPAAEWADPRNIHAAIVYGLSGGDPNVLKLVLDTRDFGDVDENLIRGAYAYASGKSPQAMALLKEADPRKLDIAIAAHVALVRGALMAADEPDKAVAMFDVARLLAPGTLVEEAALRRSIMLLASVGKHDRFSLLAAQYLRRFKTSAYARTFRRQFAAAMAEKADVGGLGWLPRIGGVISSLAPGVQKDMYMEIARTAIANGKIALARFAAANAAALTKDSEADAGRSKVYEGSALILTEDFDAGLMALMGVKRDRLSASDGRLLDAAFLVAQEVRRWPSEPQTDDPKPKEADLPTAAKKAQDKLADLDKLLNEAQK